MNINTVYIDQTHKDIIIVISEDGSEMQYRMGEDGILHPGRVYDVYGYNYDVGVSLFLKPDGIPEILRVIKSDT